MRKPVRRKPEAPKGPSLKSRLSEFFEGPKKTAIMLFPAVLAFAVTALVAVALKPLVTLQKIEFTGNAHLSDEELRGLTGLKGGENLMFLSAPRLSAKLADSPWIRSAAVRKDLPGKLMLKITEAEPFALLDMKGRLFILDETGRMLEEIKPGQVPFLPIISGDPFSNREGFREALGLAKAVRQTGLSAKKDHVEIISGRPQELAMNLDGLVVKVGAGEYPEKISRLMGLEGEIKNRRIPVDYIDLRFADRVVVKAVNEVVR